MKNAAIICGGYSSEFDISVKSAVNIFNNFPENYTPYLVEITKKGWKVRIKNQLIDFNSETFVFLLDGKEVKIDLSIIYIHGDPGENGKLQSYLDMIDMAYVNSGPLASQLSFDKWFCNQFLKGFGYLVAESIYMTKESQRISNEAIISQLKLPLFVKPCDSGSSYGISKVNHENELTKSIDEAFSEGDSIILEGFLDGTEVTCGVYNSLSGIITLPLSEIVTENDFFDFEAKYKGLSEEITPARISNELTKKVQRITKEVYELLQLKSICRVDFMIVKGEPFIIEINTIPGFSNESIVPKMIQVNGMTTKELWTEILKKELTSILD